MIRQLAALAATCATSLAGVAAAHTATGPRRHDVGSCRVWSLSSTLTPSSSRARSFVIDTGRNRVLVGAAPGTERLLSLAGGSIDAVLLTSLSEEDLAGVVTGGGVRYAGSRILVDRGLLYRSEGDGRRSGGQRLNALRLSGRLFAPEANVDVLPGIRFTIPPATSTSPSRVRISCGDLTIMVLDGDEIFASGLGGTTAAHLERSDPTRLRAFAGDKTTLAITDPAFPALASIYRHQDGFRLGDIAAREFGGVAPLRGQVIVGGSLASGTGGASLTED